VRFGSLRLPVVFIPGTERHAYDAAHSGGLSTLPCRRRYLDHFFQRLDYQPIERFCQVGLGFAFGVAHSALHASATARLYVPVRSRMHLVTPSCLTDCQGVI